MILVVRYNQNGNILSVGNITKYTTADKDENAIMEQCRSLNAEKGFDEWVCVHLNYPGNKEIEQIFDFLLGEKKYKQYADLDKIYDKLWTVESYIDGVHSDICDASNATEQAKKMLEEYCKEKNYDLL